MCVPDLSVCNNKYMELGNGRGDDFYSLMFCSEYYPRKLLTSDCWP